MIMARGESSVTKVFASQVLGPEFKSQNPCEKANCGHVCL